MARRMPPKKKPKTPQPPRGGQQRPVQAPQVRSGSRGGDMGEGHRKILYGVAGAGIVGLVAVVLVIVLSGGGKSNNEKVASLMTQAGCTFKTVTASVPNGVTHVASLTAKLPWNTNPPSNGQHYPQWAVWGFYNDPVNPRMVVHNEEHGGVILWWGPKTPKATVDKLRNLYESRSRPGRATRRGTAATAITARAISRRACTTTTRRRRRFAPSAMPIAATARRGSRSRPTRPGWARRSSS
jgi:hypothetical protein